MEDLNFQLFELPKSHPHDRRVLEACKSVWAEQI